MTPVLFDYQEKAVKGILDNNYYGLMIPCGDGKTLIILEAIKRLLRKGKIQNVLIIAPLRVIYSVWKQESEKWEYGFKFHIQHGKTYIETPPAAHIYLTTPDLILKKNFKIPITDMLVIDESTKFKNWTSKRFKIIRKYLPYYKRRIISTGSLTPKSLLNLFSQVYLMDLGKHLGKYITHYKNKYFYPTGYGGYTWELKEKSFDIITDTIKPFCIYVKSLRKNQRIKYNIITLEGSKDFYQKYKQLKKDFSLKVKEGEIIAKKTVSLISKLRQLSTGACYLDNETTHTFHTKKVEALIDLVEELQGEPLLVAYNFSHEYRAASEKFKKTLPVICGKTSVKQSEKLIKRWNNRELPVLFVHPAAMAHGLNLQYGGHTVLWYSLTNDPELYHQLNNRLNRHGQEHTVTIHNFLVKNTLEFDVRQSLIDKEQVQNAVLQKFIPST